MPRREWRSVKSNKRIYPILFLVLLAAVCVQPKMPKTTNSPEIDTITERMTGRCEEIVSLYQDLYPQTEKSGTENPWLEPSLSQSTIDRIESLLIEAGLPVLDTEEHYPAYLTDAAAFQQFWDAAKAGEDATQEILSIQKSGKLAYRLFTYENGIPYVYSMHYPMAEETAPVYEKHEIMEWELTEKGNFFYRIYPAGDKHIADFTLIRLTEPDRELYDTNRTYIRVAGYLGANIFLTDWSEKDYGSLSFNDLLEYFYEAQTGSPFLPEKYAYDSEKDCYHIPAHEFESVILPYFQITPEKLRLSAEYNEAENCYYWYPIQTNDYAFLKYYTIEPEVTSIHDNQDGTITILVELLSTDLKTDCLFSHAVTVRPLENGAFEYVANKITYRSEYGLPHSEPRQAWDRT